MSRPLLSLWQFWFGALIVVFLLPCLFLTIPAEPREQRIICSVLFAFPGVFLVCGSRWLWRFSKRVRRFRTRSRARIVLHYPVSLEPQWNMDLLLERCQSEFDDLAQWFGFCLRRRVTVFLLERCSNIKHDFRRPDAGLAFVYQNAIVVANDTNLHELIRHELAHLFAGRWAAVANPLFNEGLAVWLQRTSNGAPIDTVALRLLRGAAPPLSMLLQRKFFFSEQNQYACYILAGSFTGFLIRRHGLAVYRKFFRKADAFNFQSYFRKIFGVTFVKAEWQWRAELQTMAVLRRRLHAQFW
jgi:hypothetical protein